MPDSPGLNPRDAWRLDWGPNGLRSLLADNPSVVVIVDVLSFTTTVDVATFQGTVVLPYKWDNGTAEAFADEQGARLAGRRGEPGPTLSPASLRGLLPGTRLVLPSPNGAALAFAAVEAGAPTVLAGCLRNATAVATAARRLAGPGGSVAIVAAGERWHGETGPLRVAVEDLLGAGAIVAGLDPVASVSAPRSTPEAAAARGAFLEARPRIGEWLARSASGRELIERGYADDVAIASALDVSPCVPVLRDGAFVPLG